MEYIEQLKLISQTYSYDSVGNVVSKESVRSVYAKKKAVGSKEFYNATAVGITPTAELQIRLVNYNGETEAIYCDKRYSVVRTIPSGKFDITLVLSEKEGVN